MRQWKVVAIAGLMIIPAMVMAQNARMQALGTPNVKGANLISDVSDVLYFPADVATSTDMLQGATGGGGMVSYVYASKKIMNLFSLGFVFGKPSFTTSNLGVGSTFHGAMVPGFYTSAAALTTTSLTQIPTLGSFDIPAPTAPGNAGHMLLGLNLGSSIAVGADLFREASNMDTDSKTVTVSGPPATPTTTTVNSKGFSNYGAMGILAGASINLGFMRLKAATGFVNLSHSAEIINKASSITGGITTTYNTETSNMDAISGSYLPIMARASMVMGPHALTGGIDYTMSSFQFEAKFNDGDVATVALAPIKTPEYASSYMGIGLSDEMKVADNTTLIASATVSRASQTTTPDPKDDLNPAVTTNMITFPYFTLGMEHRIMNWWKIDEVVLRAGGNKSATWTSGYTEGTGTKITTSNSQTVSAFGWNTGVSLVKGNLELALCIAPTAWNSVYFIGGAGPVGSNVTLTYKFGGPAAASLY